MMSLGLVPDGTSRAFWDGCDYQTEEDIPTTSLNWDHSFSSEPTLSEVDLFLAIEGNGIRDFVKTCLLLNSSELGRINDVGVSLHQFTHKKVMIASCEENISRSGEVTSMLLDYIKNAKRVITLSIRPLHTYLTENTRDVEDEITLLRAINSQIENVPKLEIPNFIVGVTAGIASYRKMMDMSVEAYVAFIDKRTLDSSGAAPILQLLRNLGIDCTDKYSTKFVVESSMYT